MDREEQLLRKTPERSIPVPIKKPSLVSVDTELLEEERKAYGKLCTEIGFMPAALIKEKALALLRANQFKIYPYEQVKSYLDREFGVRKEGVEWKSTPSQTWGWCPLREVDMGKCDLVPLVCGSKSHYMDNGEIVFTYSYHGAVPFAVLDLVKQVIQVVPEISFFVSDCIRPEDRIERDPFLAISTPGLGEMIVIAEWDEPSFRS